MKSTMKKLLALVCVLALGVGCIAVHAPTEEVKAAEETTDITPVYLEGFQHVTLSSFNTKSDVTNVYQNNGTQFPDTIQLNGTSETSDSKSGYLTTLQGAGNASFDKTMVSFWVDFNGKAPAGSYFLMAGATSDGAYGIRFNFEGSSQIVLKVINNWATDKQIKINASSLNLPSQNTAEKFLLQVSFEYGELAEGATSREVKVGIYVNGKMYDYSADEVIDDKDKITLEVSTACLGRIFRYLSKMEGTLESCVPENKNWEKLTWSDFLDGSKNVAENQAYMMGADKTYVLDSTKYTSSSFSKLNKSSFEINVRFTGSGDGEKLHYGTTANWSGLAFLINDSGSLYLRTVPSTSGFFKAPGGAAKDALYFYPDIAGVGSSFIDTEFSLKITNQCADYDGDTYEDDVELGIFINGKLYNNQYIYIVDYQDYTYAGNKIGILTKNAEIMIRSTPQVDEVLHQLSTLTDAKYTTLTTDLVGAASVYTGNTLVENLDAMAIPGDYMVKDAEGTDIGQVILYEENDTHPDGSIDAVDLVAMLKVQQGTALSTWSGTMGAYAADFSETNIINEILGIETVSE